MTKVLTSHNTNTQRVNDTHVKGTVCVRTHVVDKLVRHDEKILGACSAVYVAMSLRYMNCWFCLFLYT